MTDRLQIHKTMLLSCIALSAVAQCLVLGSRSFTWQAAIRLLVSVLGAPVGSLLDAAVMTSLQGTDATYGSQRMWGAVGFGVMTFVSGQVVDTIYGWAGVFIMYAAFAAASIAVCVPFKIEHTAPSGKKMHMGEALRTMAANPEAVAIFTTVVLSGMASGIIDTFLFVYLYDLKARGSVMGIARFIMCAAEVPLFFISGRLIAWAGIKPVIAMAQAAYVLRFIYYSLLRDPWWVLPSEVLHGFTYGVMWSATTAYAHSIAPPGAGSTAQGIVSGLHWGLGFGTGSLLGGQLYEHVGPIRMFQLGACLSTISFGLITLTCLVSKGEDAVAVELVRLKPTKDLEGEAEAEAQALMHQHVSPRSTPASPAKAARQLQQQQQAEALQQRGMRSPSKSPLVQRTAHIHMAPE
eukprot:TRINITY_DN403_c0_g1_i1.p1 TRINITY_DN403_c0_g1~~TRINITY_DN403_c0_g1_i1.p1  ORF type:complete len:407 (-),score=56.51 TRINITY_DN403_c0_g1_i1:453-1673(-)